MRGSRDRRPFTRRAATKVLNRMLWVTTGFEGTDTHGLKAFRRDTLLHTVGKCVVDRDLFARDSEEKPRTSTPTSSSTSSARRARCGS